jgi:hypothetical protein
LKAAQTALTQAQGSGNDAEATRQQAEIDRLNQQKTAANAAIATESERMQELKNQQSELQQQLTANEAEGQRQRIAAQMAHYDNQQQLLEAAQESGAISQAAYNERSLNLTIQRLDAEAKELQRQKQLLDPTDTAGQEALNARLAAIQGQRVQAQRDFLDQQLQLTTQHYENEQQILDGAIAQGLMSEGDYNQKSLNLTMERLDAELSAIQQQRSQLTANQTEEIEALAAKEAEIYERRAQAQQAFYRQQMEMVERAAQKVRDEMELAQTQRETELQELINSGAIRQEQANVERVELRREALEEELAAEEDHRRALEALPVSSDPRVERDRQAQIRAARIETARITGQLAQNEFDAQKAAFDLFRSQIDRQVQGIQNKLTAESQALEQRIQLSEAMERSLDNQVKLLDAQRNLQQAISGAVQGDLAALSAIARTEREKKELAQAEAAIKLQTLAVQQDAELRVLEIQREQARIAREREQIALRIRQIENQSQIVAAQGQLRTAMRDPNATPEQIQSLQLNLQGLLQRGGALQMEGDLLNQQGALDDRALVMRQQATLANQRSDRQSAQVAFAQTLTGREQRAAFQAIRNDVFGRYGARNQADFGRGVGALVDQTVQSNFGLRPQSAPDMTGAAIAAQLSRATALPAARLPQLQSPQLQLQVPGSAEAIGLQQQIADRIGSLQETMQQFNGITIEQQNQTIVQADRRSLNDGTFQRDLEQAIVNTQYSVMQKIEQISGRGRS